MDLDKYRWTINYDDPARGVNIMTECWLMSVSQPNGEIVEMRLSIRTSPSVDHYLVTSEANFEDTPEFVDTVVVPAVEDNFFIVKRLWAR